MKQVKSERLNLTIDKEFYSLLKQRADQEYLQVGTYVRQFLMKNLSDDHNLIVKPLTKNDAW